MSRHDRQRGEVLELCDSGAVKRAVDLAFQHLADFGPDHALLARIGQAIARTDAPAAVRHRFNELCALAQPPPHCNGTGAPR